jgi:hypothetical protein
MRYVFLLAIGLGAGYYTGFKDGKARKASIVERVVEKVGGSTRGKYKMDVDAQVTAAEQAR